MKLFSSRLTGQLLALCCCVLLVDGNTGYGGLGCWRDHTSTKSQFAGAITVINRYITGGHTAPGDVLRAVQEVVWPSHDVSPENMYCFDEEYHGDISPAIRRKYANIMDGFRIRWNELADLSVRSPRDPALAKALQAQSVNLTYFQSVFLEVIDIEQSSLYLREYALLVMGVHAELINFNKAAGSTDPIDWTSVLALEAYKFSKFSYWFLRYMPKKMADYIVFDKQKFTENHIGLVEKINGKRLGEYGEHLARCALKDNIACQDYSIGFLKVARITQRHKLEEYWKEMLHDFRRLLFKKYCIEGACTHDRYDEFLIKVGEPLGLQFQASNEEGGYFCSGDLCKNMWLSTAGYRDYFYYRGCFGDNPINLNPSSCPEDVWSICTKTAGCDTGTLLTNNYFPVALRSSASTKCVDCSAINNYCTPSDCPAYLYDPNQRTRVDSDTCSKEPSACLGAQFQIHNFERGMNEPLQVLDEVHFGYANKREGDVPLKFLAGELYWGAFVKTQYYMKLEDKLLFSSKKTGRTTGPFNCPRDSTWSMMNVDERAACAQSSFTLFKKIDPAQVIASVPERRLESDTGRRNNAGDRRDEVRGGDYGQRVLDDDDAPYSPQRSSADRNRA